MKPQYFLALLFLTTLYWMYHLYQPFLMSITIASLLAMSTANIQHRLELLTGSPLYAALISTFLLAVLFFAPLGYFLTTLTIKLNTVDPKTLETVYENIRQWLENSPDILAPIMPQIEQWLQELDLSGMASKALSIAGTIGSYSASFLKNALFIIIFYFFAQYNGKAIVAFIKQVVQLPKQDTALLGFELTSVMSVVFYSIITTAMFEGALFGIAISFMGYNGLLFGIMYGFASLIPVVGGALMWLPFMVYEFSQGNTGNAIFIALYSIIVISIVADTFVKPWIIKQINLRIIKSEAKMNELLIFFAIIAGLATFGFWGMILGPAITAFFLSLLKLIEQRQSIYAAETDKSD
ncbi:MAG: AI-2E family transporter [Sulfurimonadaceae bacterium]|nr:AI-2E family transporter [Sulfurimonadaceae bacterium]